MFHMHECLNACEIAKITACNSIAMLCIHQHKPTRGENKGTAVIVDAKSPHMRFLIDNVALQSSC